MRLSYLFIVCLFLTILSCVLLSAGKKTRFEETTENIAFRMIGHELLLSAGDSTSRVMPVKKISESEFQLSFEKPFPLTPDSLVRIASRIMRDTKLSSNYAVNVIEAGTGEVFYAFSVATDRINMIPCVGRLFPSRNYRIDILMNSPVIIKAHYSLIGLGILIFALVAGFSLFLYKLFSNRSTQKAISTTSGIPIGKYLFYSREQLLVYDKQETILTPKESRLLSIFCTNLNAVIDRNRLLKEGWEDEGVITTRSLDMFVSKLRKKLSKDTSIQIRNHHGKGYSLQIPLPEADSLTKYS